MVMTVGHRVLLSLALIVAMPLAAAGQGGDPGLEGERWDLTAYAWDGRLEGVPWDVDATLLLESGTVAGSAGCDRFEADYALADGSLTFGEAVGMTQLPCDDAAARVEAGYLAALPSVSSWTIEDEALRLADADGRVVLEFATPVIGLTANDVAALAAILEAHGADISRLEARLDNVRIGTLRDRIQTLEAEVKRLRTSTPSSSTGPSSSAFSAAERTLLKAIPAGIRRTCVPRREQNPAGTAGALQCKPRSAIVRDMAYYLMPGRAAQSVWQDRMDAYEVKYRERACPKGRSGFTLFTGGIQAAGCYVNEDGRANLRYLHEPWECAALEVGGSRVASPVMYIAVLGTDDDLATLTRWAEPRADARPTALFKRVPSPDGCVPPRPM